MRSMVEGACSNQQASLPTPLPPREGCAVPLPRYAGQDEEGAPQLTRRGLSCHVPGLY